MNKMILGVAMMISIHTIAQDSTKQQTRQLSFSGYAEVYYNYDLNRPADNNRPAFLFSHNRHNEFNVNLAYVKGTYSEDRVRANIALAVGTYMNANYAAEPDGLKNIYEANAGYKLIANKNLWLDIGVLPSHIGFESAQSSNCWTLTRSLAAENSPYFESGARLSYTTNDNKLQLAALALNGWQSITRINGNSLMSWGTQVYFVPTEKVTLNYSTFFGTDKPDTARLWRYYHNVYGIFQITSVIGLTAGFDIGMEQKTKGGNDNNTWYAPVGILRITTNDNWAFAVRGEYFSDKNGVIINTGTPDGFKSSGVSLNVDYKPYDKVFLRLEARNLNSKDAIFKNKGTMKHNNTSITLSAAVGF